MTHFLHILTLHSNQQQTHKLQWKANTRQSIEIILSQFLKSYIKWILAQCTYTCKKNWGNFFYWQSLPRGYLKITKKCGVDPSYRLKESNEIILRAISVTMFRLLQKHGFWRTLQKIRCFFSHISEQFLFLSNKLSR